MMLQVNAIPIHLLKMLQFSNFILIQLGMRRSCEVLIFINLEKALTGKITMDTLL